METRCCTKCNEVKPIDLFNKRQGMCKVCQRAYDKQYKKSKKGQESIKKYSSSNKHKKTVLRHRTKKQGIYGWYDGNLVLYIGQSKQLNGRIETHRSLFNNPKASDNAIQAELYKALRQHKNASIRIIEECSPEVLLQREQYYINTYKPLYNKLL